MRIDAPAPLATVKPSGTEPVFGHALPCTPGAF